VAGWTAVKAAGRDVSGWGQGERSLGHRRALRGRRTGRRGGGGGVAAAVGAGGVLEEARLRLGEGQFGQKVGGGDGERGRRQVAL